MSGVLIGVQFIASLDSQVQGFPRATQLSEDKTGGLHLPSQLLPVDQNLMPAESGDPTRDTPA